MHRRIRTPGGTHGPLLLSYFAALSPPFVPPPVFPSDVSARRTRRGVVAVIVGGLAAYRIVYTAALLVLMGASYGLWGGKAFQALALDRGAYVWPVFVANALGQIVGLGAFAWWLAAHEGSTAPRYLRLETDDGAPWRGTGWTVAGILGLLPLVQLLGQLNAALPLPESLRAADAAQEALFSTVLSTGPLAVNLLLLAAVPAVCEELFFRGYVQRRLEAGGTATSAVVLSGLAFGLYHLRLTHLLPLTVVGAYLAYAVWTTQRLRPAIAAHFAYNAALIVLAWRGLDPGSLPDGGWLVVPGLVVTIWALRHLAPPEAAPAA